MKTIRKVIVVIAVAAAHWCVTAATIEVATVAALTNAVARANAGEKIDGEAIDTIVLKAGTYTFPDDVFMADNTLSPSSAGYCKIRLNVTVPGLTIKGEDNSSRTTWTNGSEPVIIDGNGGKGMQLQLYTDDSARIENITFVNCNGGAYSADSSYGNWCNGGAIGIGRMVTGWAGGRNVVVSNCVFRGNQSCLGGAIGARNNYFVYDCFFTNNVSTYASGAGCMFNGTAYGCEMVGNMNSVAKNVSMNSCNVHGNGSTNRPLLTGPATYSNCTFRSNTTSSTHPIIECYDSDVRIVNCEFSGNSNDSTTPLIRFSNSSATKTNDCLLAGCTFNGNAASALTMFNGTNPLNGGLTVTNCSFIGNTANATAATTEEMPSTTVRVLVRGIVGDKNRCMIYDSVFSNNQSKVVSGAMGLCNVLGVHAVRCTFTGDGEKPCSSYQTGNWRYYNEAADNSILEECAASNGEMRDCVVDRCRIHNVTSNVYAVFKDSAFVTNTLVECCGSTSVASYLYSSIYKHDAEFVNCTIVSNNCFTFSLNASAGSTVQCRIEDCRFVNCLFNANRADFITTVSDFTIEDKDACLNCFVEHVEFAHSAYGIFTPRSRFTATAFATKTNGVDTLTLCANPKFVQDSRPETPYWSLLPNSSLIGKGDASIWTAEDVDLVGKLRLKDGKVDPGCYQCWINPPGMAIFVR